MNSSGLVVSYADCIYKALFYAKDAQILLSYDPNLTFTFFEDRIFIQSINKYCVVPYDTDARLIIAILEGEFDDETNF